MNKEDSFGIAANQGLEELKYNVNKNPSFEIADGQEWPEGYSGFATAFRTTDYAYSADTNSGTYAGYIASHGVAKGSTSQAYLSQNFGQNPTPLLAEGVMLDFYWNTLANPDIDTGSYVYVLITTTNETGFYQEIRYYLSNHVFSTTNTSTLTCYLWDYPTDTWHSFSRDLGSDYAANPSNSPADSTRRVTSIVWYAASPSYCTSKLEFILDDTSLSNGTYSEWIPNGGFETGDGEYWEYAFSTPTFIHQTTESTDGTYALNMTTGVVESSPGYGAVERDFNYPAGLYCNEPGETLVEFDWKFNSVPGLANQSGSMDITFANETGTYFLHLLLGFGVDSITGYSNSSSEIYIVLDGFNIRNTWHNMQLDMYDYISQFGSTVGTIIEFQFYVYASEIAAQVSLLIDDFHIISSATGDPSFELDWYSSYFTPFAAWFGSAGNTSSIQRTIDSFSGTYACNLTPLTTESNLALITHPTFVDVGPDDYLDFYWRLDAMNDASTSRAFVMLYFESGKRLGYLLGASASYNPINTTDVGFIIVEDYNITGKWYNLHRNITHDAEQILGSEDWQISDIGVFVYYDYTTSYESSVSLIIDDIIITDGAAPSIGSIDQLPVTPMYYQDVLIQFNVSDKRPGVVSVIVNYTTDGGSNWFSLPTTGNYEATIPSQPYGTEVEYFIIAIDGVGLMSIDDNNGVYYSYTVDDDIDPVVSIDSPSLLDNVEGVITIVTSPADIGSGIDYVQFFIDDGVPINIENTPYSYDWNTDTEDLGVHEIEVVAHDIAGNTHSETIEVTVVDTTTPIISEPPDFEFVEGWVSQIITWEVSDIRPDSFEILDNGSQIHSGSWTLASTAIEITVDSIGRGVHNITLIVYDAGGNSASDSVFVTVTPHYFTEEEPSTNTTTPSDTNTGSSGGGDVTPLIIIAIIGAGGVLIVVLVVLPVMKKR